MAVRIEIFFTVEYSNTRMNTRSSYYQPIRTPDNQQRTFGHKEDNNFSISQSVKVYRVLLIYWCLSLSGNQVLLQQSQEAPTQF